MKKPAYGFLLGKFLPPHNGHRFFCEFARAYCEHLTILVASLPDEPIPGKLRYEWMKRMFDDGGQTCTVVWTDEVLPQEPSGPDDQAFWDTWKRVVEQAQYDALGRDRRVMLDLTDEPYIDVVFASEDYGHKLAASVGAEFVPCDMLRKAVPVSGTRCRADPQAEWDFLPDVVRPYFVKRVTLFGPESSGKSTLAAALGQHYKTVVVPEYGRTYTEVFGPDVGPTELQKIVAGHLASVTAAKMQSGRVLIEDTDPVMTAVWSDMLGSERDPFLAEFTDYADLYVLCDVDIPWVDDGTRYFPAEEDRKRFLEACRAELVARKVPFVVVSGTVEQRLEVAVEAIDVLLAGGL